MPHFITKMGCTFLMQDGALWDICLMHCGICEMGLIIIVAESYPASGSVKQTTVTVLILQSQQNFSHTFAISYIFKEFSWADNIIHALPLCFDLRYINSLRMNGAYICRQTKPSLVQIMACCLFGTKPLCETILACSNCTFGNSCQWCLNKSFHKRKWIWKCYQQNGNHLCPSPNLLSLIFTPWPPGKVFVIFNPSILDTDLYL